VVCQRRTEIRCDRLEAARRTDVRPDAPLSSWLLYHSPYRGDSEYTGEMECEAERATILELDQKGQNNGVGDYQDDLMIRCVRYDEWVKAKEQADSSRGESQQKALSRPHKECEQHRRVCSAGGQCFEQVCPEELVPTPLSR